MTKIFKEVTRYLSLSFGAILLILCAQGLYLLSEVRFAGQFDVETTIIGIVTGLAVGITGAGSGSFTTPLLILYMSGTPTSVIGSVLSHAFLSKMVGAAVHNTLHTVDWHIVKRLMLGSLPGAAVASVGLYIGNINASTRITWVGIALLLTSFFTLATNWLSDAGMRLSVEYPEKFIAIQRYGTVVAGAGIGLMVAVTSVGAGALAATILLFLYPTHQSSGKHVGTTLAHAVPLTFVAAIIHIALGYVDFDLVLYLTIGAVPAVLIGALISSRVPAELFRIFAAVITGFIVIKIFSI